MNKNFFVSTNHQKKSQFLASFWRPQFFSPVFFLANIDPLVISPAT